MHNTAQQVHSAGDKGHGKHSRKGCHYQVWAFNTRSRRGWFREERNELQQQQTKHSQQVRCCERIAAIGKTWKNKSKAKSPDCDNRVEA